MAYVSGVAADITALSTALIAACVANGWTQSGTIIYKGDVHIDVVVDTANNRLRFLIGTGHSGATITNPAPAYTYFSRNQLTQPFTYPLAYFIHIIGNEVYLFANFQTSYYTCIGFGYSPVESSIAGVGAWIAGTGYLPVTGDVFSGATASTLTVNGNTAATGLFIVGANNSSNQGAFAYTHLGWSTNANWPMTMNGCRQLTEIDNPSTNATGQTVLVPIQPSIDAGSSKRSIVLDLVHARYVRIDNIAPQEIITLGTDKWRIYPVYLKNAASRNFTVSGLVGHSGTYGYAIKYDGP